MRLVIGSDVITGPAFCALQRLHMWSRVRVMLARHPMQLMTFTGAGRDTCASGMLRVVRCGGIDV